MAYHIPTSVTDRPKGMGFCAVRARNKDGSPRVGGDWLEPLGSCYFVFQEGLDKWEIVFHDGKGELPE